MSGLAQVDCGPGQDAAVTAPSRYDWSLAGILFLLTLLLFSYVKHQQYYYFDSWVNLTTYAGFFHRHRLSDDSLWETGDTSPAWRDVSFFMKPYGLLGYLIHGVWGHPLAFEYFHALLLALSVPAIYFLFRKSLASPQALLVALAFVAHPALNVINLTGLFCSALGLTMILCAMALEAWGREKVSAVLWCMASITSFNVAAMVSIYCLCFRRNKPYWILPPLFSAGYAALAISAVLIDADFAQFVYARLYGEIGNPWSFKTRLLALGWVVLSFGGLPLLGLSRLLPIIPEFLCYLLFPGGFRHSSFIPTQAHIWDGTARGLGRLTGRFKTPAILALILMEILASRYLFWDTEARIPLQATRSGKWAWISPPREFLDLDRALMDIPPYSVLAAGPRFMAHAPQAINPEDLGGDVGRADYILLDRVGMTEQDRERFCERRQSGSTFESVFESRRFILFRVVGEGVQSLAQPDICGPPR